MKLTKAKTLFCVISVLAATLSVFALISDSDAEAVVIMLEAIWTLMLGKVCAEWK